MRLFTVTIIVFMAAMAFQPMVRADDPQTDNRQISLSAEIVIPCAESVEPVAKKDGITVVRSLQPELNTEPGRANKHMVAPNVVLVEQNNELRFRKEIPEPRRR